VAGRPAKVSSREWVYTEIAALLVDGSDDLVNGGDELLVGQSGEVAVG
jgi:hypothetical protein